MIWIDIIIATVRSNTECKNKLKINRTNVNEGFVVSNENKRIHKITKKKVTKNFNVQMRTKEQNKK